MTSRIAKPSLPAAARRAGCTKVQRTASNGNVFAVGFKPADRGGDPAAAFASLTAKFGDQATWAGDDSSPMFIRL